MVPALQQRDKPPSSKHSFFHLNKGRKQQLCDVLPEPPPLMAESWHTSTPGPRPTRGRALSVWPRPPGGQRQTCLRLRRARSAPAGTTSQPARPRCSLGRGRPVSRKINRGVSDVFLSRAGGGSEAPGRCVLQRWHSSSCGGFPSCPFFRCRDRAARRGHGQGPGGRERREAGAAAAAAARGGRRPPARRRFP